MKPKILSWNLRGLNQRDKRLRIWSLLRIWKVIFFVFKKLNWSLFLGLWCTVYGVVSMWIGIIWDREGLPEGFVDVREESGEKD
jgi:hypothetical protein